MTSTAPFYPPRLRRCSMRMMGVNLHSESKPPVRGTDLVGEGVTVLCKCHSSQFVPANCSRKRLLSGF